ncbi:GNAT family N-acetyltransferase [Lacticigenium naphthae]|uniref:GNAT family N-acetyltransferase n=1 Tax=Lacticigenium naphthae TaxID=515351 RepID=UPI00041140D1|nr:GNAT family N-acetyltransferase [Lacticigenium naphthae]
MLVKFKLDYQKITMGLLSFIPDLKETKRLLAELDWYDQEENRVLYLWKSEETEDFVGVIGIEITDNVVLIRHIALNPSFRHEKLSYEMFDALAHKFFDKKIMGTFETAPLISKWQKYQTANDRSSNQKITSEEGPL